MITRRQIFQAAAGIAATIATPIGALATTSSLDTVNVRRLINFVRDTLTKQIEAVALFEPNDATTRQAVHQVITNALDQIPQIHDYAVVCDEVNNTPAVIDRNELRVDVAVMPYRRSREYVYIPIRVIPA